MKTYEILHIQLEFISNDAEVVDLNYQQMMEVMIYKQVWEAENEEYLLSKISDYSKLKIKEIDFIEVI